MKIKNIVDAQPLPWYIRIDFWKLCVIAILIVSATVVAIVLLSANLSSSLFSTNEIVPSYTEDSPTSITTLPTYEPYFKQMTVIISLEGMLSSEIGNLRSLEYLELRENNFDGQIPTDLGLLQSLTLLDISDLECITEASIPSEVGNLSSLKTFYTKRSRLRGALPTELFGLVSLEEFNLSENSLSGSLLL